MATIADYYDEFNKITSPDWGPEYEHAQRREEILFADFEEADGDENRRLDKDELQKMETLPNLNPELAEALVDNTFLDYDEDQNEKLDKKEFEKAFNRFK